ncbi:helix-turn-helix transcriptional regulator [Neisseria mucosa]|nr:AlpA family phage regulatory protein [Neisseria mucosa]
MNTVLRHHRPDFPKPIKLSENITGWLSSEIEEYLGKLAAKREEQAN